MNSGASRLAYQQMLFVFLNSKMPEMAAVGRLTGSWEFGRHDLAKLDAIRSLAVV